MAEFMPQACKLIGLHELNAPANMLTIACPIWSVLRSNYETSEYQTMVLFENSALHSRVVCTLAKGILASTTMKLFISMFQRSRSKHAR